MNRHVEGSSKNNSVTVSMVSFLEEPKKNAKNLSRTGFLFQNWKKNTRLKSHWRVLCWKTSLLLNIIIRFLCHCCCCAMIEVSQYSTCQCGGVCFLFDRPIRPIFQFNSSAVAINNIKEKQAKAEKMNSISSRNQYHASQQSRIHKLP